MAVLGVLGAVTAALLTAVLFVFVAYTVYLVIVHRRYAHIPQPKGASFYGGHVKKIKSWLGEGKFLHDLVIKWFNETGLICVIWLHYRPIVYTSSAECVQILCSTRISKGRVLALENLFGQRFIARSVLTLQHYHDWKVRRKTYDPSFSRSYLNSLVPVFNKVARDHIDNLRSRADGETVVDMLKEFAGATLQMISTVAFGQDFTKDQYVQSLFGDKGLLYLMAHCLEGVMKEMVNPPARYMRFGKNLSYAETGLKIRQIGEYCIRKRLTALENNEEVPHDILTLILQTVQTEKNIEIEELIDDFVTFYVAGQETTGNLLSFCIVLLQQHPDVLHRVMEEIEEVVGDKTTVEADDLDKLTYMNQVLEETLRDYPPVPALAKESPQGGVTLCGYNIPEKVQIVISSYAIQHLPEYYDDPYQFKPSRFDPDHKRPSPYVYMPFGLSYRTCIGRQFAMMEAKVLMVHLLRTFHVTLAQDYKLEIGQAVTLHPKGGVPCTLIARR